MNDIRINFPAWRRYAAVITMGSADALNGVRRDPREIGEDPWYQAAYTLGMMTATELGRHASAFRDFEGRWLCIDLPRIPSSLRFIVMRRDGYRCQLCGRSTREDGVKLHVDHKVPRARGGGTYLNNLWTLCRECNIGKGTRGLEIEQGETPWSR